MPSVMRGSLEERILELALERYPVTAAELARELGLPERRLMMELRRMASRGLVELDVLPDSVFVRPLAILKMGGRSGGRGGVEKKGGEGGDPPGYA